MLLLYLCPVFHSVCLLSTVSNNVTIFLLGTLKGIIAIYTHTCLYTLSLISPILQSFLLQVIFNILISERDLREEIQCGNASILETFNCVESQKMVIFSHFQGLSCLKPFELMLIKQYSMLTVLHDNSPIYTRIYTYKYQQKQIKFLVMT